MLKEVFHSIYAVIIVEDDRPYHERSKTTDTLYEKKWMGLTSIYICQRYFINKNTIFYTFYCFFFCGLVFLLPFYLSYSFYALRYYFAASFFYLRLYQKVFFQNT